MVWQLLRIAILVRIMLVVDIWQGIKNFRLMILSVIPLKLVMEFEYFKQLIIISFLLFLILYWVGLVGTNEYLNFIVLIVLNFWAIQVQLVRIFWIAFLWGLYGGAFWGCDDEQGFSLTMNGFKILCDRIVGIETILWSLRVWGKCIWPPLGHWGTCLANSSVNTQSNNRWFSPPLSRIPLQSWFIWVRFPTMDRLWLRPTWFYSSISSQCIQCLPTH